MRPCQGPYSREVLGDPNKYVHEAARVAEMAKVEHRKTLEAKQKRKATLAEANGNPLSAEEKKRARWRRESSAFRKKTEIYTRELEKSARLLSGTEQEVAHLSMVNEDMKEQVTSYKEQVRRLKQLVSEIQADQTPQSTHSPPFSQP